MIRFFVFGELKSIIQGGDPKKDIGFVECHCLIFMHLIYSRSLNTSLCGGLAGVCLSLYSSFSKVMYSLGC
jgi:hypothetical protein